MSREFGDHGSGFFHNKLSDAADDAKTGTSIGAKLMAAILDPLSKIAYWVSGEEACDSSDSEVIREMNDQMPAIKGAIHAIDEYLRPSREYAARLLAAHIKATCKITQAGDCVSIELPRLVLEQSSSEVYHMAIVNVARDHAGKWGYWSGSSWGCRDDCETHNIVTPYHCEDNVNYLRLRVQELEQQVALLKATSEAKRE